MKFIYADSLDYVDPGYDFLADRMSEGREPYWDDKFSHEFLAQPPYDGVLVSRGIIGDYRFPGKYSESQQKRFRRVGARTFLRLRGNGLDGLDIFGDCGAFSYHKLEEPPYTAEEMVEFYADGDFTHGCSVDHVIFDFDRSLRGMAGGSQDARQRYDITLRNAGEFLKPAKEFGPGFTPLGVVQGWSPGSMANAAHELTKMGYDYLALGGMVPLNAASVHMCLRAIREVIPQDVRLHLLGFAKAEQIQEFTGYNITSFDSTSPLLRAFKDSRRNYYSLTDEGYLHYYSAVRIPQALENPTLMRLVKAGVFHQEELIAAEGLALEKIRAYAARTIPLDEAMGAIMQYATPLLHKPDNDPATTRRSLEGLHTRYLETLRDRPWEQCGCEVCTKCGVEVVIFRASNRNKRRGIHNLKVYYDYLHQIEGIKLDA